MNEKLKKRGAEVDSQAKDIGHKADIIKKLEQQVETIPALKNKIKEMENMLNNEALKASGAGTYRGYNRTSKDTESLTKALSSSNVKRLSLVCINESRAIYQVRRKLERIANHSWEHKHRNHQRKKDLKRIKIRKTLTC